MNASRILVAAIFGAITLIQGIRYSRKPRTVADQVSEPARPLLNLLSWLSAAGILAYVAGFGFAAPVWTSWMGRALLVSGFSLWFEARRTLGMFWSRDILLFNGHQLVASGPYRYVRHPMYASFILLAAGLLLTSDNLLVSLPYLAYVMVTLTRLPKEDALLGKAFGNRYATYASRTGSLFPNVSLGTVHS